MSGILQKICSFLVLFFCGVFATTGVYADNCSDLGAGYYYKGGVGKTVCPAGRVCPGTGTYTPGNSNGCLGTSTSYYVYGGYYSTGGAKTRGSLTTSPTCLKGYECGAIAAGYYATLGAMTATPTVSSDCVGSGSCGKISAGYYSTGAARSATPSSSDCNNGYSCGVCSSGYSNSTYPGTSYVFVYIC